MNHGFSYGIILGVSNSPSDIIKKLIEAGIRRPNISFIKPNTIKKQLLLKYPHL